MLVLAGPWWWLACAGPSSTSPLNAPLVTPPPTTTPTTPTTPTGTTTLTTPPARTVAGPALPLPPGPPCVREEGWDEPTGARTLRLDLARGAGRELFEPLLPAAPFGVTIAGALPGDEVHLFVGDLCALDCPRELDGACFQPHEAREVVTLVAGGAGQALVDVTPDPSWSSRWLVFQATVPARGAVSQAWVDRLDGWHEPMAPARSRLEVSPVTMASQWLDTDEVRSWWWPVAAGRRVVVDYQRRISDDDSYGYAVANGDMFYYPPSWTASPSAWYWWERFDYDESGAYWFDITTRDLDAPADWYPDLDGDGYGDPGEPPVSSAAVVVGASPDPRDCDDQDPGRHPNGLEACGDGVDQDCAGGDQPCGDLPGGLPIPESGVRVMAMGMGLAAADLDGDGRTDLVTDLGQVAPIGRSERSGPAITTLGVSGAIATGELTGDGVADLVHAPFDLTVYARPGEGALAPGDEVAVLVWPGADLRPAVGDLTGDGQGDLVLAGRIPGRDTEAWIEVYPGPLSGTLGAPSIALDAPGNFSGVALSDVDGDGRLDVWSHEVCLYLSPLPALGAVPDGCVDDGPSDNLGLGGMTSTDVDLDGYPDLVTGTDLAAVVFLGPLSGRTSIAAASWATLEDPSAGESGWSVSATPDRDGDGAPELLVSSRAGAWAMSATPGVFGPADGTLLTDASVDPRGVLGGDFDGDGSGDIALSSETLFDMSDQGVTWVLWGP